MQLTLSLADSMSSVTSVVFLVSQVVMCLAIKSVT